MSTASSYEKVSVTLPRDLVTQARARVGARGLSAHIAEGLRLAEHLADLDEFLTAHTASHGPVPDHLMQEVRQAWPDPDAEAAPMQRRRARSSSTPKG
jgi:hypothetical protein